MQSILWRMDKQQDPTVYSAGNCIQYPVINHNGEDCEEECIHV